MKVYIRRTGEYKDIPQYGQGKLEFLYGNAFGRILLKIVINPATSRLYGRIKSSKSSVKDIPDFIRENNIDMNDFEDREFTSFSDFFTRRLRDGARVIDQDPDAFISPADSKLLVYKITPDLMLDIKGSRYTLDELVDGKTDMSGFAGGYAMVFRLSVDDYHRYCFIDKGRLLSTYAIKGRLHTVSSISSAYKIYKENSRVVNLLNTDNFSDIIHIEVGALLVGRIVNHDVREFSKGQEKGYFEPGGSTIIIIAKKDAVRIDSDIMEQSAAGVETAIRIGERIGTKI